MPASSQSDSLLLGRITGIRAEIIRPEFFRRLTPASGAGAEVRRPEGARNFRQKGQNRDADAAGEKNEAKIPHKQPFWLKDEPPPRPVEVTIAHKQSPAILRKNRDK
jgi:hypothetical protein